MWQSIVNASQWKYIQEEQFDTYSCGGVLPTSTMCQSTYLPFAWVRIDRHNHQILAARDHFGQEPLYYFFENNNFIFGSNIPDILAHLEQRPSFTHHLAQDCFLRKPSEDLPLAIETYYKGIFRVKPGHYLVIKGPDQVSQEPFWQIDMTKPSLNYIDERDYVEHFSELLNAAVLETTQGAHSLAAEFSGGVDSTMVFTTCRRMRLEPTLYTQAIPSHYTLSDETHNVDIILRQYDWKKNHCYVNDTLFDPFDIFKKVASIYASPPPYLLGTLASNLHQMVATRGHDVILSGVGGDDLVSHSFPPQIAFPQKWQEEGCYGIYQDLKQLKFVSEKLRYIYERTNYSTPFFHHVLSSIHRRYRALSENHKSYRPSLQPFYPSLRQYEYNNVQGDYSHELLMRIEYDAILAKSYGFRFAYPLLYPPLIEFCLRLPLQQKLNIYKTRLLARRYLAQEVPLMKFRTKGGSLAPNTMQKCRNYRDNGLFTASFQKLPFDYIIQTETRQDPKLLLQINAYILALCTSDS